MGGEDATEEVEVAPEEVEAIVCEDAIGSACGVGGTAGAVVVGVGSKSERSVVVIGRIGIAIPAAPKRGAGVANPGRKTDAEESVLEGAGRRCGTSVTAGREVEEEEVDEEEVEEDSGRLTARAGLKFRRGELGELSAAFIAAMDDWLMDEDDNDDEVAVDDDMEDATLALGTGEFRITLSRMILLSSSTALVLSASALRSSSTRLLLSSSALLSSSFLLSFSFSWTL